jgi:hypothetical protein
MKKASAEAKTQWQKIKEIIILTAVVILIAIIKIYINLANTQMLSTRTLWDGINENIHRHITKINAKKIKKLEKWNLRWNRLHGNE